MRRTGGEEGKRTPLCRTHAGVPSPYEWLRSPPARRARPNPLTGPGPMSPSEAMADRLLGSPERSRTADGWPGTEAGRRPELAVELLSQIEPCAEPASCPTDMVEYCSRIARALVATHIDRTRIRGRDSEILLQRYTHGILDGLYGSLGIPPHLDGLPAYLRRSAAEASTLGKSHGGIIRRCWETRHTERGSQ